MPIKQDIKWVLKKVTGSSNKGRRVLVFGWTTSGSTFLAQCVKSLNVEVEKAHSYVHPSSEYSYDLKLFTIRDPRDIIASDAKRTNPEKWEKGDRTQLLTNQLNRFLVGNDRNMESYNKALNDKKTSIIRYETFFNGRENILIQFVADQLGLSADENKINKIIEENSVEKNLERASKLSNFKEWDKNSLIHGNHITNKGKSGGWKDTFTPEFLKIAKDKLTPTLIELGYVDDQNWASE